jgi:DNA-binding response OmpR family regulator
MNTPSVLVIDDDSDLVRQMMATFAIEGWDVRGAPDGESGLASFRDAPADLVVTDMIMPTREGIETIMALKQLCPGVKIIAISGGMRLGPSTVLSLARHLGADEVLAKPFRPSLLLAVAMQLLARSNAAAA